MEAVAGHTHLYRRGAVYWFRRRVPEDVAGVIGHAQWRSSLGTKDFEEAKRLVRLRGVETDREVALARARMAGKSSPPLAKPEAHRLAQQWVIDTLAWDEDVRVGMDQSAHRATVWVDEVESDYREALANLDVSNVRRQVDLLLTESGRWYPEGDSSRRALGLELLKAQVRLVEVVKRRLRGEVVEVTPPVPASVPAVATGGTTVKQLIAAYRAEREALHGAESTDRKYSHIFRALEEALGGDRPIRSVTRGDLRAIRELLIRTPAFAMRRYPGLSLTEAADRAEADGAQRIAPNTVNSYLHNLAALFNWAVAEELLAKSPATGLVQKSRPSVKRRGFTPDELTRLFAALTPYAAGPAAWKFWVPALALYSGARAGELTGLRVEDLRVVHGVQCMAFSEFDASGVRVDGRRLKTATSERVVPIHKAVLDAGLMSYVGSLPKAGGLLFPTLPAGDSDKPSHEFSKWFGRFRRSTAVGLSARATAFHSFRHGFRDACRDAGITTEIADALGGWATSGVGTQYGDKGRIELLSRELAKVTYDPFALPTPTKSALE